MTSEEVPGQFDALALVYDATHDPPGKATLDRIAEVLRARGVRSLLELGVGTGRVAAPLSKLGFEVTGVDAAPNMLVRARAKGLQVVLGSAYTVPFRDRSFDATFFVHVLNLLEVPPRAIQEGVRVARHGAFALVRPSVSQEAGQWGQDNVRERVRRALAEEGVEVPTVGGGSPERDQALLKELPPAEMVTLSDQMITEPYAKDLDFIAKGGSRHFLHVPAEVLQRAVENARKEVGDRTFSYRSMEVLAVWKGV